MSWVRFYLHERRRWGAAVAWSNLRFLVGYAIGGFTMAHRCDEDCGQEMSCPLLREDDE